MLFFIVAWSGLILASFVIGIAILNCLQENFFERTGDYFIVAVWLGLVTLAVSLLATSLVLPLSSVVAAVVTASIIAVALTFHRVRADIASYSSEVFPRWLFRFIALAIIVAFLTSRSKTWFDTEYYHFQIIKWLSEFGTVPGIALIHTRLGFGSSLFALGAAFNTGILENRITALINGFAFLLGALHCLIGVIRIWRNDQRFEDWFLVFSSFFVLPVLAWTSILVSSSPDVFVIILTLMITWVIIYISNQKTRIYKNSALDVRLIPVILSAGAVTIKFSAVPLLFISGCFYIFDGSSRLRRILMFSIISFLILLPTLGTNTITSGCPLFPISSMCFELPWSLKEETVKQTSQDIHNYSRWSTYNPPAYANFWNWIWPWIQSDKQKLIIVRIIYSILSVFGIVRVSDKTQIRSYKYVLALGILGIIFLIYSAPHWRFGLGYLSILPAFLISIYFSRGITNTSFMGITILLISGSIYTWLSLSKSIFYLGVLAMLTYLIVKLLPPKTTLKFLLIFLLFSTSIIPLQKVYIFNFDNPPQLLLPPKLQASDDFELLHKEVNNVRYVIYDQTNRCWSAQLPCARKNTTYDDIRLRSPEHGIKSGFIRE